MLRYTLLRTLIFFGVLCVLWLVGLRGRDNMLPLVIGAALISMLLSYFVLKPFRQDYSREIAEKLEARAAKKADTSGAAKDAAAEDAEDETYR